MNTLHFFKPAQPNRPFLALLGLACLSFGSTPLLASPAAPISRDQLIAQAEKIADAQLAALKKPDIGWVAAVMWAGYADFSHVSSNPKYARALDDLGTQFQWTPRTRADDPNHADDLCITQAFLDVYAREKNPAILAPARNRIEAACEQIDREPVIVPPAQKLTWWWCDALFMAPPAFARLSVITGDARYLNAMDEEWWKTAALLYGNDNHLFARDKSYLGKRTANGSKVYWSRGNGWVFAGLARTLTYIPANYRDRSRYVAIFKAMATELISLQQPDGTWPPSLLDAGQFPYSEMSGTALDCFAIAWGINNGILDKATYLPVAEKAWAGMIAGLRPDGVPGYVQGVGAAPAVVYQQGTQLYATGAFLMAASQLAALAPIDLPPAPTLTALVGEQPSPTPASAAASPNRSGPLTLHKISDTVVDPSALTFPPNSPFGSTINGEAFQQDIIHTSANWQYVAYYDDLRHVCVARRQLPAGPWQILRLTDYDFKSKDAHNSISLGICEKDGTIHLAFDHHVTLLHYRVSKTGVATHPDKFPWDASLFGPVHSDLEPGKPVTVTYPRFWNTPGGGLQIHFREGGSGNGNNMLADYNPATGTWSGTREIDSSKGTFQDDVGTSTHRNAYPNGYDYDSTGRLQATWVWREDSAGDNHDLQYDYSDDGGKTWHVDSGATITGPAQLDTPGLTVVKISRRQGLMNNQAQAIDSHNRMHVVMWSSDVQTAVDAKAAAVWGQPADRRYHHYWREASGQWHDDTLPWVAGSRPRLFADAADNLFLIYSDPEPGEQMQSGIYYTKGDLVVASATAATGWKDWKVVDREKGPYLNEALADPTRWTADYTLSIIAQETPAGIGQPSALHVIDLQETP